MINQASNSNGTINFPNLLDDYIEARNILANAMTSEERSEWFAQISEALKRADIAFNIIQERGYRSVVLPSISFQNGQPSLYFRYTGGLDNQIYSEINTEVERRLSQQPETSGSDISSSPSVPPVTPSVLARGAPERSHDTAQEILDIPPEGYALTYSVHEADSGSASGLEAGGWGVQERSSTLDPAVQRLMQSAVRVEIKPITPTPSYPTQDQLDARPIVFTYQPVPGGELLVHSAEAGLDATGRPGNVFSHVELVRTPEGSDTSRPIDYWDAKWLQPYGERDVQRAKLSESSITQDPGEMNQEVKTFLTSMRIPQRVKFLTSLDALSWAREGNNRTVVIAVPDEYAGKKEGAMWIAAATHLMGVEASRKVSFSTFERLNDFVAWKRDGNSKGNAQLVIVPHSDIEQMETNIPDNIFVIETGLGVSSSTLDVSGKSVPVSDWSKAVDRALTNGTLEDYLAEQNGETLSPDDFAPDVIAPSPSSPVQPPAPVGEAPSPVESEGPEAETPQTVGEEMRGVTNDLDEGIRNRLQSTAQTRLGRDLSTAEMNYLTHGGILSALVARGREIEREGKKRPLTEEEIKALPLFE